MKWKRIVLRVILFALLGLLIELFFTSFGSLAKGNFNMRGHSSPWMMPVYGLLGVCIGPVTEPLKRCKVPLIARAILYMLGIFLVEYIAGAIFYRMGLQIWDYSKRPLNLHGYITLTYAPFWLFLGLWIEYLYKKLDACAVTLASGTDVKTLLEKLR
jgi:uncharacterized membrane protein